ncbi:hypothetical protein IQ07DRAFT_659115 [Pyrenochaeta sp. DS3sAY3a]|nr:hypothetical protein IQ07DRAFT_659115 [Pyrenochaeta sp. DS3sAY3a]
MALSPTYRRVKTVPGSCWTCKSRRIRCDLTKPICRHCIGVGATCEYAQNTSKRSLRPVPNVPISFQPIAFPRGLNNTSEDKAILYFHGRLWPLLTVLDQPSSPPLQSVVDDLVVCSATCLLAESHRFLQDRRNAPPDTIGKRKECIEAVNMELDRCSAGNTVGMRSLLFAILLLNFYEGYIECSKLSYPTLIHHNGIQATIDAMGGLQRVLTQEHRSLQVLISLFATADLTTKMLRGSVPSLAPVSWRLFKPDSVWWHEHLSDDASTLLPSLGGIFEQISNILIYRKSLIDNSATLSMSRIKDFEEALQPLYSPFTFADLTRLDVPTNSELISHHAFLRAYQHTVLIYLYREVCGLPIGHPIVQQHVNGCLDAIDMVPRRSKTLNCLVFPLLVAGSHSRAVLRRRQVLRILIAIQSERKFISLQQIIEFSQSFWG